MELEALRRPESGIEILQRQVDLNRLIVIELIVKRRRPAEIPFPGVEISEPRQVVAGAGHLFAHRDLVILARRSTSDREEHVEIAQLPVEGLRLVDPAEGQEKICALLPFREVRQHQIDAAHPAVDV